MRKTGIFAGIVAALLLAGPVLAADATGITAYPASFFDASHPSTAADMLNRLPGFTLDTGNGARGFAGTAGNVLIDGTRPTAKTDDLNSILARIPAGAVDRIELIRGGAPGIDMQGQNVVANIVRKAGAGNTTILTLANTWVENGQWFPAAQLEYHGSAGALTYEVSLAHIVNQWDDSPGLWLSLAGERGDGRQDLRHRAQLWRHAAGLVGAWRRDGAAAGRRLEQQPDPAEHRHVVGHRL